MAIFWIINNLPSPFLGFCFPFFDLLLKKLGQSFKSWCFSVTQTHPFWWVFRWVTVFYLILLLCNTLCCYSGLLLPCFLNFRKLKWSILCYQGNLLQIRQIFLQIRLQHFPDIPEAVARRGSFSFFHGLLNVKKFLMKKSLLDVFVCYFTVF